MLRHFELGGDGDTQKIIFITTMMQHPGLLVFPLLRSYKCIEVNDRSSLCQTHACLCSFPGLQLGLIPGWLFLQMGQVTKQVLMTDKLWFVYCGDTGGPLTSGLFFPSTFY